MLQLYKQVCRTFWQTMKENLIDKFHEANMLYFVLVSIFSADTLVDAESCRKSLKALAILKRDFETSSLKDDQKLKSMIDGTEEIILRDLYDFEETGRI